MSTATEKKVIPYDSDEAACLKTVTGWVSRDGIFCGDDERAARYRGCTHKPCADCGELIPRDGLVACRPCLATRDAKRFAALPQQEWDGVTPLVLYRTDTYFFDEDELDGYCAENDVAREDLPLVICEPVRPRLVSALDLFEDALPEDAGESDVPAPVRNAVDALNSELRAAATTVWTEGRYAAAFTGAKASHSDS